MGSLSTTERIITLNDWDWTDIFEIDEVTTGSQFRQVCRLPLKEQYIQNIETELSDLEINQVITGLLLQMDMSLTIERNTIDEG
jgi:hypothetical protein